MVEGGSAKAPKPFKASNNAPTTLTINDLPDSVLPLILRDLDSRTLTNSMIIGSGFHDTALGILKGRGYDESILLHSVEQGNAAVVKFLFQHPEGIKAREFWERINRSLNPYRDPYPTDIEFCELAAGSGSIGVCHHLVKAMGGKISKYAAQKGLRNAIQKLDHRLATYFLKHGATLRDLEGGYSAPIVVDVAFYGTLDEMKLLLGLNNEGDAVDVNTISRCKSERTETTALHAAARRGHTEMVQLLLDHGADIEAVNLKGFTPIMVATGDETTKLLLSKNPDLSASKGEHCQTALHGAAAANNVLLMRTLFDKGLNSFHVNTQNFKGQSALHLAAYHCSLEALHFLCDNGADLELKDNDGCTPLLVERCDLNIIRALINRGADITATSEVRGSVVHNIIVFGYSDELVEVAIKAGVDINARSRCFDNATALHLAVDRPYRTSIVKLLIDAGCAVNLKDARGDTPLHIATHLGCEKYVELLFEAGADMTLTNDSQLTAWELTWGRPSSGIKAVFDNFEAKQQRKAEESTKSKAAKKTSEQA